MNPSSAFEPPFLATILISSLFLARRAFAADIRGQVLGASSPITQSTVTLFAASAGTPKPLGQTKTDSASRFMIRGTGTPNASLYLVATGGVASANKVAGDNPAIALIVVLGAKTPARVVINELTTVASVWTNAQFLNDTTLAG